MSPALTRRGLVQAGAAALGVAVANIPAAARAANPDAMLLDLIDRHTAVVAERNAFEDPLQAIEGQFAAGVPPYPAALTETFSDVLDHLTSTGRDTRPDGRPWVHFIPGDVERLRAAGSVMDMVWNEDGQLVPNGLNVRGEARRLEILAAYDAWTAEKQALSDRIGLTAATAEDSRLYELTWSCRDAIREMVPATLAGLCAKAKWALTLDDAEDENEQVVRDLAAFGEASS